MGGDYAKATAHDFYERLNVAKAFAMFRRPMDLVVVAKRWG